MPGSREFWTEERVGLLRRLRDDGVSYEAIAVQLGVTRSAISGKVDRLGLSARERRPRGPRAPRAVLERRPVRPEPVPEVVEPAMAAVEPVEAACGASIRGDAAGQGDDVRARGCSLLDLTERSCRWPIGDPGQDDFFFCGEVTAGEGPYCAAHRRVAYRPFDLKPMADLLESSRTVDPYEQPANRFGQFADWDVT